MKKKEKEKKKEKVGSQTHHFQTKISQ